MQCIKPRLVDILSVQLYKVCLTYQHRTSTAAR
nr:MAG TPA: hypothetical protein [Caudoviricetes sp.]